MRCAVFGAELSAPIQKTGGNRAKMLRIRGNTAHSYRRTGAPIQMILLGIQYPCQEV